MIFADIIVDISVKNLDRPFQYRIPEEMENSAVVGAQVLIPFGKGNRKVKGYIIGLSDEAKYDITKTKSILAVEKQGVVAESHLLSLAYWIKENYGATMNDAIKAVMPVKREVKEKCARRIFPKISKDKMYLLCEQLEKKHQKARVRLLQALLNQEEYLSGIDYETCVREHQITLSVVRDLEKMGVLGMVSKTLFRNPLQNKKLQDKRPVLNEEQKKVIDAFESDIQSGIRKEYLLYGVTGSGKTEVYMHMIETVLKKGKQAIVLIPEIALTFQTVNRFLARFGERVSIMHSRLSHGERYDQFVRAKNGEIQIMIGPRSALFTPFANLGLIVMDEEHESSYQSDHPPKYHAREVAVERARMLGASVVLGSATPSLEAFYRCLKGEYQLLRLTKRAGAAILPTVEIVDLREELAKRNYSVFSMLLQEKIEKCLERKEQVMLFINRRGFAGFVSCRECGKVIQCKSCSVALKPHHTRTRQAILKCHYCGAQEAMPKVCPSCGSKYIGTFGLGTQQVEEMVKKRFPSARVLRMDADTTAGKEGHDKILHAFKNKDADILVGTQMIVKGHDFPNVTLVGILAADLSLNAGDYRAAEKTFQLLAQAAGRAGRGKKAGDVILQTYQPEHYSVVCAAKQDYISFYRQEIQIRQMLQYPPVSNILEVLAFSEKEALAEKLSAELGTLAKKYRDVTILGPVEAPIAKLRDVYRRVIYIKSKEYAVLRAVKDEMEQFMRLTEEYKSCRITFRFN